MSTKSLNADSQKIQNMIQGLKNDHKDKKEALGEIAPKNDRTDIINLSSKLTAKRIREYDPGHKLQIRRNYTRNDEENIHVKYYQH